MLMKEYSAHPRYPELKSNNQMLFSFILWTLLFLCVKASYPLTGETFTAF